MISNEILDRLVPRELPKDGLSFGGGSERKELSEPSRRIGIWADLLRRRLRSQMDGKKRGGFFQKLARSSSFIATGVFRAPKGTPSKDYPGFSSFEGFQFGVMLMRGEMHPRTDGPFVDSVDMGFGGYRVPVMQTVAELQRHSNAPNGYVAATYVAKGENRGLTAGHVVKDFDSGDPVPVWCSVCAKEAELTKMSPGLLDTAVVSFPCGGPQRLGNGDVRRAQEGEHVEAHFGLSGKEQATVMSSLQTFSQLRSAAIPEHFLIDEHGQRGDSGSLVCAQHPVDDERDLLGVYLGKTRCEDEHNNAYDYGFALNIRQAAELSGIDPDDLKGEFHD